MDLMNAMTISASGMKAQGTRMRVISENLANSQSAANRPDEDPYRRKMITFKQAYDRDTGVSSVSVDRIEPDRSPFKLAYKPHHPGADENGYVKMPNVNSLIETMDMREAQRSYEANLGAIQTSRTMMMRGIELLRGR